MSKRIFDFLQNHRIAIINLADCCQLSKCIHVM